MPDMRSISVPPGKYTAVGLAAALTKELKAAYANFFRYAYVSIRQHTSAYASSRPHQQLKAAYANFFRYALTYADVC